MTEISFLLVAIYSLLIASFIKGWNQIPTFHFRAGQATKCGISVIVACRNEAKNLPRLLESLRNQSLKSFQLILVDDHSTDETFRLMQQARNKFKDMLILQSDNYGKKHALKSGIENATYDLIVTTDADCSPTPQWLETIIQFYEQNSADLIIGAVAIEPANTNFEKLQQLEFLSLVSSGAGAAGIGQAIMCNGANLAFKKDIWLKNFEKLELNSNSGDDVFLLHALKKQNANIHFLKSEQAIVFTKACTTISSFFKQRIRWSSKSTRYSDFYTILVAAIVLLISLLQVNFFVYSFVNSSYLISWGIITGIKLAIDTLFLLQTSLFFGQKNTAKTYLMLAVIYPFYIVLTALYGIFQGLTAKRTSRYPLP